MKDIKLIAEAVLCFAILCAAFVIEFWCERTGRRA
jgi:hypothetical protein